VPKKVKELSAKAVRDLKHSGRGLNETFSVGGVAGLLMQITPTNARSWVLRTMVGSNRREIGLGGFPDVTLARARDRAREAKDAIRLGIDPIEQKRAARAALAAQQALGLNFAKATEAYLKIKLAEFDNDKHRKQWRATLDAYAVPTLGPMLVSKITVHEIARTLEPIWTTKTETASRLRGRIEAVLTWATVAGHREGENPARWRNNLDAIMPKKSKVSKVEHQPALALADVTQWFADLQRRDGTATRALEFLAMTSARSGEVRGATWGEIDTNASLWTIPAVRMKAGKEHRVPLTLKAVALLKAQPKMEGSEFVFPAARGGMLSDMALSACMRRINKAKAGGYIDSRSGRPAVPHGIRSTFRDWVSELTNYPRDMAEISLAHSVGSEVERAYRRGDQMEKRRAMMADWGQFLKNGILEIN
jgi:integrase